MSKEDDLKALRQSNTEGVVRLPVRVDDTMVMRWLDDHRRKATTIEEVEIIDMIVKCLFREGVNKIRVHGERDEVAGSNDPQAVTLGDVPAKFDKKAYQRDLMRKKRAKP